MVGEETAALRSAQRHYKNYYERRLRFRADVRLGDSVYVDRPPS